jgi:PEP-CTERM motif
MKRFCWTLVLIGTFAATARGGEVTVSGAGMWGSDAPTTAYSAPDTSWSFSVNVANPVDGVPTFSISNAVYLLGGSPAGAAMTSIFFYTSAEGGGIDLNFADNNTVSLYGSSVIDDSGNFLPGTYSVQIAMNDNDAVGVGGVVIAAAVPEPSTLVSLSVGLLCVAAAGIRSRRRPAA